jgi:hypothetical protein
MFGGVQVRTRGTAALGKLMPLATRIDPLVSELLGLVASTSGGVQESVLEAITSVMWKSGGLVTPPIRARYG